VIGHTQLDLWSRSFHAFHDARPKYDKAQFADVAFKDLLADPIGTAHGIYERFGLDWTPAAQTAIERARSGGGPSLIESKTYRHGGHSRADPGTYRPPAEIEAWMAHDPLPMYHQRLLRVGATEADLTAIVTDVAAAIDAATESAKAADPPDPSELWTNVWADGGWQWRN
jgi:hypothetical protein